MPRRSALRITKRTVDALCVADKDTVFWDRDLAGFGVRIHATGRKVYVVQTRGPAGPKRVTLGLHGELSTDEARKRAGTVIDRIKRGEEPVPAPPEPEFTVAALAERFMRVHVQVHCKPRTVTTYRSVLDGHILPALGATAISAVGPSDIATLHHRLRDTPGTANGAVRVVSAMFRLSDFKGRHFGGEIVLWAVRWYCRYPISYRDPALAVAPAAVAELAHRRDLRQGPRQVGVSVPGGGQAREHD